MSPGRSGSRRRRPLLPPGRRLGALLRAVFEGVAPAEGEEWLALVVALLLLLAAVRGRLEPWLEGVAAPPPDDVIEAVEALEPARFGRVDLNRAGPRELESLPRIGPRLAARIIADREQRGPFARLEDLERVPGIGPVAVAALRDAATVGPPPAAPGSP